MTLVAGDGGKKGYLPFCIDLGVRISLCNCRRHWCDSCARCGAAFWYKNGQSRNPLITVVLVG